MNTSTRNTGKP